MPTKDMQSHSQFSPYAGITQIRFMGRSHTTPSQPNCFSSPSIFYFFPY